MVVVSKYDTCTVHPGELYFGTAYTHIRTLLGSCVAVTAWHPKLKVGGLCHYLLTEPKQKNASTQGKISARDYRYAQNALLEMRLAMLRVSNPKEFQIGLFGGGGDEDAFSETPGDGDDTLRGGAGAVHRGIGVLLGHRHVLERVEHFAWRVGLVDVDALDGDP